jgi:hypothetical protein
MATYARPRNPKIAQLLILLTKRECVFIKTTAQRDIAVLNIDPPLTIERLIELMHEYVEIRDPDIETMDSREEAFVFKYIQLTGIDLVPIPLYVKAKFGAKSESLIIFAAHPDRRW